MPEAKDLEREIYVSEVDSLRAIEEKQEEIRASEICLYGAIKAKLPDSKIQEIFREGQRVKIELIKLLTD